MKINDEPTIDAPQFRPSAVAIRPSDWDIRIPVLEFEIGKIRVSITKLVAKKENKSVRRKRKN